jgi:DNA-binding MarR family transcriptional regulator
MPNTTPETFNNDAPLAVEALKRFRLIIRAVQQYSNQVESRFGVSGAQLWILWELSRAPGLKVTDLARALSIHHSTASNLLDKLNKKGLIIRERNQRDQRVVTVSLTPQASDILAQSSAHPRGILQNALFELPDDTLGSLTLNLDVLIAKMQIQDDEATMQPIDIKSPKSASRK